jgi:hypothetical protein
MVDSNDRGDCENREEADVIGQEIINQVLDELDKDMPKYDRYAEKLWGLQYYPDEAAAVFQMIHVMRILKDQINRRKEGRPMSAEFNRLMGTTMRAGVIEFVRADDIDHSRLEIDHDIDGSHDWEEE